MENLKKVVIAGCGVLGSQIAIQCALHGYDVTIYKSHNIEKSRNSVLSFLPRYEKDLKLDKQVLDDIYNKFIFTTDLEEAVQDADLVIETVPEVIEIKTEFYKNLGKLAPEKTIFATNSSTFLPSMFMEVTGRPEKFAALHFANEIWIHNTAEVMGTKKTSPEVFATVEEFAKSIGMVTLPLRKEQPGYILNSLLVPLLSAATDLWADDVADIETIDKTWMLATGAPLGPFAILDIVGINTAHNIFKMVAEKTQNPVKLKAVEKFEKEFMELNKLGVATGEGFYKYPNPAYKQEHFLE